MDATLWTAETRLELCARLANLALFPPWTYTSMAWDLERILYLAGKSDAFLSNNANQFTDVLFMEVN